MTFRKMGDKSVAEEENDDKDSEAEDKANREILNSLRMDLQTLGNEEEPYQQYNGIVHNIDGVIAEEDDGIDIETIDRVVNKEIVM